MDYCSLEIDTNVQKYASIMRKGAFQADHHGVLSTYLFKTGPLLTLLTLAPLHVHQFTLFCVDEEQPSLIIRLLSTLMILDESKCWQ